MKKALAVVALLGLMGAAPAWAHVRVGGTVRIRYGRPAPPPVVHYRTPVVHYRVPIVHYRAPVACPPVVTYSAPVHGRWEYRTTHVWHPGYWTTVHLPCGGCRRQWVPGRYEVVRQRVWVH